MRKPADQELCYTLAYVLQYPMRLHYENTPIQKTENFTSKNWKFSEKKTKQKNSDIF